MIKIAAATLLLPISAAAQVPAPHDWRILGFRQDPEGPSILFIDAGAIETGGDSTRTVTVRRVPEVSATLGGVRYTSEEMGFRFDCGQQRFAFARTRYLRTEKVVAVDAHTTPLAPFTRTSWGGRIALGVCDGDWSGMSAVPPAGMAAAAAEKFAQLHALRTSLTGVHWANGGVFGSAPHRLAQIFDRDSIYAQAKGDWIELNGVSLSEGGAESTFYRLRIACAAQTTEMVVSERRRADDSVLEMFPVSLPPSKLAPDAALMQIVRPACARDWSAVQQFDGPRDTLAAKAFPN